MQTMQMALPDDNILNHSKSCHLVAKFATNASVAMLLPNLVQFTESISGSVVPLAMFVAANPDIIVLVKLTICQLLQEKAKFSENRDV